MLRFAERMIMVLTFSLAVLGVLVITYASKSQGQGPYHFCVMQSLFLVVSLVAATIFYFVDYHVYRRPEVMWGLLAVMVISLLLVHVPGLGRGAKGAHRWISLGPLSLQPIEFVKLFIVVVLSAYMDRLGGLVNRFVLGFLVPVGILVVPFILILLQPDFGGSLVYCALAGVTLLLGGLSLRRCAVLMVVGVVVIATLLALNQNRMRRLQDESSGKNEQAIQSERCFRNGGVWGKGIVNGMQKEYYLPECHTDFIFAVIGEDLGLVATSGLWMVYLLIFLGGTTIALRAPDKQGMALAFGATLLICAQAGANMAVVTHLFPTKGLALPFLSYGGSCLLASFSSVGILLNVGRVTLNREEDPTQVVVKPISFV